MEKSPIPGKPSSPTGVSPAHLTEDLRKITENPNLKNLYQTLGDEAQLHLVGGCLREVARGLPAKDIDLASALKPAEVIERLKQFRIIETGIGHGTLTILFPDEQTVELTTFRKPGSRAENSFSETIAEDLAGRDFTINAMAYAFNEQRLIDPFEGLNDLQNNLLRCVGDAHTRFIEDPLRLLRMLRFGPAQGLEIDAATFAAACKLSDRIASVSIERIQSELSLILTGSHPAEALRDMLECGLLKLILPEMLDSIGFAQNEFHVDDVFEHTLWVVSRTPADLRLRLAGLFHDLGKPHTLSVDEQGRRHFYKHEQISAELARSALERLSFPKAVVKDVCLLVAQHMRPLDCGPAGVRRLLRDLEDSMPEWLELKKADSPPLMSAADFNLQMQQFLDMKAIEEARLTERFRSGLAIDGNDLIALGIPAGPQLGIILDALEEVIIEDPEQNERASLLQRAEQLLSRNAKK